jgi:hypothetical protein
MLDPRASAHPISDQAELLIRIAALTSRTTGISVPAAAFRPYWLTVVILDQGDDYPECLFAEGKAPDPESACWTEQHSLGRSLR